MVLAADYPFLDVMWTMLVFFLWIAWFMLLFHVIGDVFRRRDASGAKKTLWLIVVIVLPFLGVFVYLIANGDLRTTANQKCEGEQQAMERKLVAAIAKEGFEVKRAHHFDPVKKHSFNIF